jgi:hypothetical protein
MRILILLTVTAGLLVACASEPQKLSTSGSARASSMNPVKTNTRDVKTEAAGTGSQNAPARNASAPVDLISVGIAPDREHYLYKLKVNTDNPISEVEIDVRLYDARGKMLDESPITWQNIVNGTRQTTEKGRTYEATHFLEPDSTRVEAEVKHVYFGDGSIWSAQ